MLMQRYINFLINTTTTMISCRGSSHFLYSYSHNELSVSELVGAGLFCRPDALLVIETSVVALKDTAFDK